MTAQTNSTTSALMSLTATCNAYIWTSMKPIDASWLPFGPLDLFGLWRLSTIVSMETRPSNTEKGSGKRAPWWREIGGMMIIMFGAETFLACVTGVPPPWLSKPKVPILSFIAHFIMTRTPLRALIPSEQTVALSLACAIPDAVGRAYLLTFGTVRPLLHPGSSWLSLPATPSSFILVPFLFAVPFAAFAFTGVHVFAPSPYLSTPAELKPWGWTSPDFWLPIAIPALFLSLVGPVEGWNFGLSRLDVGVPRLSEDAALVICAAVCAVTFVLRALYKYSCQNDTTTKTKTKKTRTRPRGKKVKTA